MVWCRLSRWHCPVNPLLSRTTLVNSRSSVPQQWWLRHQMWRHALPLSSAVCPVLPSSTALYVWAVRRLKLRPQNYSDNFCRSDFLNSQSSNYVNLHIVSNGVSKSLQHCAWIQDLCKKRNDEYSPIWLEGLIPPGNISRAWNWPATRLHLMPRLTVRDALRYFSSP